jgi:hypothetical protein
MFFMAHSFLIFDFGGNEDAAQQARHRIDGWKQGFRLDKKLQVNLIARILKKSRLTPQPRQQKPQNPAQRGKPNRLRNQKLETSPLQSPIRRRMVPDRFA